MTQQIFKKIKKGVFNIASIICISLLIAAFYVVDKNVAMGLMAIAVGIAVFLAIIDKDFRRKF